MTTDASHDSDAGIADAEAVDAEVSAADADVSGEDIAAAAFDVVIVGGGMVGSLLAALLADSPLSVALLEPSPPVEPKSEGPGDLRVSAINPASRQLLAEVGAWETLAGIRVCPYRRLRVWEEAGWGDVSFSAEELEQPELGHIVENGVIQWGLWKCLMSAPRVQLLKAETLEGLEPHARGVRLRTSGGKALDARLVVGADGAGSRVRGLAGIGTTAWDYAQWALVLQVVTELPQQDITWQRFLPAGPQAMLPLRGARASLVWYQSPDQVQALMALDDQALLEAVMGAFPAELGALVGLEGRGCFALQRQHAQNYSTANLALVGDAAHGIHPLAGQGVNLGFADVAALSRLLKEAAAEGPLRPELFLERYEHQRRWRNEAMMDAMEALYRGFGNDREPLRWMRNLGLAVAQRSGPLKVAAARVAMGLQ